MDADDFSPESAFARLVETGQMVPAILEGMRGRSHALRDVLARKVIERNAEFLEVGLEHHIGNYVEHDLEVHQRAESLGEEAMVVLDKFKIFMGAASFLLGYESQDARHERQQRTEAQQQLEALLERRKEHPMHNKAIRESVWAITDGKCFYCDVELIRCIEDGEDRSRCFHIDHFVPKASGGPDHLANYVPACEACNISKGPKSAAEFILNKREKLRAEALGR